MRKFEREQQTDFEDEIKRFQQEQTKQYKIKKDTFKKVSCSLIFSSLIFIFQEILSSSTRGKSEKEDEIRRLKDDLLSKQRNEEQTLKTQILHDHNVRRLQLKRRKLLLLHVLEQKLFEEVCSQ